MSIVLTQKMIVTLNLDLDYLHRRWFSPEIWVQENSAYTYEGFNLKYGLTKKMLKPKSPLLGDFPSFPLKHIFLF